MKDSSRHSTRPIVCRNRVKQRTDELANFRRAYEAYRQAIEDILRYGPVGVIEAEFRAVRSKYRGEYEPVAEYLRSYTAVTGIEDFEALGNFGALRDTRLRDTAELMNVLYRTEQAITLYGQHLRELARAVG